MIATLPQVKTSRFIDQHPEPVQKRLKRLREIILSTHTEIKEEFKWKMPFYSFHGSLCYLNTKGHYIDMGFAKGAKIKCNQDLFSGNGLLVRHLKLDHNRPLPVKEIKEILIEATALNNQEKEI